MRQMNRCATRLRDLCTRAWNWTVVTIPAKQMHVTPIMYIGAIPTLVLFATYFAFAIYVATYAQPEIDTCCVNTTNLVVCRVLVEQLDWTLRSGPTPVANFAIVVMLSTVVALCHVLALLSRYLTPFLIAQLSSAVTICCQVAILCEVVFVSKVVNGAGTSCSLASWTSFSLVTNPIGHIFMIGIAVLQVYCQHMGHVYVIKKLYKGRLTDTSHRGLTTQAEHGGHLMAVHEQEMTLSRLSAAEMDEIPSHSVDDADTDVIVGAD